MYASGSEEILIEELRKGEPEAFDQVVEDYSNQIFRLAYGITHDAMEAQDIIQDVLVTLFRKINEFQGKSSILTWLYRVTVNASLDRVRKRKRRSEILDLEEYLPKFKQDGHIAEDVVDWSQAPLDNLLNREAMEKIKEAIDSLPEEMRVVLIMKDVEGFQLKQICDVLELSLPAIKSRLHRARMALRGILASYFAEDLGEEIHGTA